MEDDIQYLGTNSPLRSFAQLFATEQMSRSVTGTIASPSLLPSIRIVTSFLCLGISFHTISGNAMAGQSQSFYKTSTPVVHIGRGSSKDEGKAKEADMVTFDCPVISRKQAKIIFSETGHVCLVLLPLLSVISWSQS